MKNRAELAYLKEPFLEYVEQKDVQVDEIDLYDENRNYLRTIYRGQKIDSNEWKKCILCFVIDKKGKVLVERKDYEKDMCSGHIKHYEVATQAVIRELYEELGINIEESITSKYLGNIKIDRKRTNGELQCFLDVYCLFRTHDTYRTDNNEIKSTETISFREFIKKFTNNEIFPHVSDIKEYLDIIEKLIELYAQKFEKRKTHQVIER